MLAAVGSGAPWPDPAVPQPDPATVRRWSRLGGGVDLRWLGDDVVEPMEARRRSAARGGKEAAREAWWRAGRMQWPRSSVAAGLWLHPHVVGGREGRSGDVGRRLKVSVAQPWAGAEK